jgi:hypothetical protein
MLSMRQKVLGTCCICGKNYEALAEHALKIIKRILSMLLKTWYNLPHNAHAVKNL